MAGHTTNLNLIKPAYDETADIADINTNSDTLDSAINGKKPKQTAVTDPTANGTSATFIATITQNANGVITPTKKTVRTMSGATSSAAGATGLVPAPGTGDVGKFLKGDGTWGTPTNTTYSAATSSALGLVKTGYTTSGKNYAVQLDSNNKMYVNVPWTDNNTTYSAATSSALGLVKIGYSQNSKNYPVQLDGNSKAYVNVPWTDTNTTYSNFTGATASAAGANGLVPAPAAGKQASFLRGDGTWATPAYPAVASSGTAGIVKIGYTQSGKNYPVQLNASNQMYVNVPWTDNNTTYSAGTGLTLSSNTFSVNRANVSTMINLLEIGDANSTASDYLVAQYSGGGTSSTSYFRRPVSKVVNGTVVKAALGTDSTHGGNFLRKDGTWAVPAGTSYGAASADAYGLIKIGFTTSAENRNYAVKLSSGKAYVNVPWVAYTAATQSTGGLMSASDKTKLDGIATGAQVNPGVATTSTNGLMSSADKTKLNGIAAGAQVNPGVATTSANGLMSSADKAKLNGIAAGAQVNPGVATTSANGLMSSSDKTKLDGIAAGAQVNPGVATTSANGLMSSTDKTKLNGIESGAQVNPGVATSSALGLIKIGYSQNEKNYPVALSDNKAYVNVPWTNTWRAFSVQNFDYEYTISANGTKDITGTNFNVGKTGYTPVAVALFNSGSTNVVTTGLNATATGSSAVVALKNLASSSITATAYISILYLQNS